jgi:tyrosine-protein kinase
MSALHLEHSPVLGGALDRLGVLRRRAWIVVLCALLVPAAAWAVSVQTTKQWTAGAELLFRDPGFDQKLFGSSYLSPSKDPSREAATNLRLVSLDTVFARAAKQIGRGVDARTLVDKVNVRSQGQSDVVAIEATDRDPRFAAHIANVIARQYIAFRRDADRSTILNALRPVEQELLALSPPARRGPQGQSLERRAEELRMFSSLQTGNAELVQPAPVPVEPSSPRTARNVALGVFMGLLLGGLLSLLAERLDPRLRDPAEIEGLVGRPILAEVPQSDDLQHGVNVASSLRGADVEAFRTLRIGIRYSVLDKEIRSIVVTSAAAGEGKSTIALNLALSAALSGSRTVLLEADLRRPSLARALGLPPHLGLAGVLLGEATLDEVIQTYPIDDRPGASDLEVVTAGGAPPNPSAALASDKMWQTLEALGRRCDQLIIDTPPLTVVSDAIPLGERASGILIVVRHGRSARSAVRQLRRRLDNAGLTPLGIVLNAAKHQRHDYYYGGGYHDTVLTASADARQPVAGHASAAER